MMAANLVVLPDKHIVQQRLEVHFPVSGDKLTKKTVLQRMKAFLAEVQWPYQIDSERKAMALLSILRKKYRKRDPKHGDVVVITGTNPEKIPVTNKKPNIAAEDLIRTLLIYGEVTL
jgi:hypothetical protein